MTPRQVALRFMGQAGTTVGDPDFIVAYLEAELAKDPQAFHTEAMKNQEALQAFARRYVLGMNQVAAAFAQAGRILTHAGEQIARSVNTTTRDQVTLAR